MTEGCERRISISGLVFSRHAVTYRVPEELSVDLQLHILFQEADISSRVASQFLQAGHAIGVRKKRAFSSVEISFVCRLATWLSRSKAPLLGKMAEFLESTDMVC